MSAEPFWFCSIDPGESDDKPSSGLAVWQIEKLKLRLSLTLEMARWELADWLSTVALSRTDERKPRAAVVEQFRLYPWMARQQGYSEFPTVELIGVIKWLAARHEVPVAMQGADRKKPGRELAAARLASGGASGFEMVERQIGNGRYRYRGWDFDLVGPNSVHQRDAAAHGVWWAFNGAGSPLRYLKRVK